MAEPFLGQISMVGFNFAPRGWAMCNGQLMSISQNTALFALLGTTYGGNGQTTFGLPDLRGRVPLHLGQGPGLSNYIQGQSSGTETNTLTASQMPAHNHPANCQGGAGNSKDPTNRVWSRDAGVSSATYSNVAPNAAMNASAIGNAGGNQPFSNIQPYLCLNFIIALEGIFPSRN